MKRAKAEFGEKTGLRSVSVWMDGRKVGTLALSSENRARVAFEYEESWIEEGFSISPFSLPLRKGVFFPDKLVFDGLFGVFSDSLPDAWGRLLMDRVLSVRGVEPGRINALDRLSLIGSSGMGALEYRPEQVFLSEGDDELDLDEIAEQCTATLRALEIPEDADLDRLYRLGGSSGGARPKILTEDGWIIKFPAHVDAEDAGIKEYEYSLLAKKCGLSVPETKLLPSKKCAGYFAVRRFDRVYGDGAEGTSGPKKVHMVSAAALLEADYRQPSIDYADLLKLTKILTRDHKKDVWQMFRLACFNVFAGNQDDHAKNFSFLYFPNEKGGAVRGSWRLAPAYDLTKSHTFFGEQTTSVLGKGRDINTEDLAALGAGAGLNKKKCKETAEEMYEIVREA